MTGVLRIEDDGAVRQLAMSRPEKRNALNADLIGALSAAFEQAAADDSVRCLVLRGEGPMFSSGMDLANLRDLSEQAERLDAFRRPILAAWNLLEQMKKPTVAVVHGAAIGGAAELSLACDFRIMAADALWGLAEARIGLIPDVGGCSRLPAVVGLGRAKELIMTGRMVTGEEAHAIGLANRIAPADGLDQATAAFTGELLACAPLAVGLAKNVIDMAAKPALAATLEAEGIAQRQLAVSGDFAEGAQAFLDRRAPAFAGR